MCTTKLTIPDGCHSLNVVAYAYMHVIRNKKTKNPFLSHGIECVYCYKTVTSYNVLPNSSHKRIDIITLLMNSMYHWKHVIITTVLCKYTCTCKLTHEHYVLFSLSLAILG